MPTRIVRIIARLNVGGPALHCHLLGERLRSRGFETLLLTGALGPGEAPFEGRDAGPSVVQVPGLGPTPAPGADLRALASLVRILRRERPALVHTHTAKAGALGRVAARLAGVPRVVHTFHGHVLAGYFSPVASIAAALTERALAALTDRIVTLSPGLRDELLRYGVGRPEQYAVVPLGRELAPLRLGTPGRLRAERGLQPDAFVVAAIGRLVPIKDVPTLVRAFAQAAARLPDAHLVIAGDGPERRAIEEAAAALGLRERVHLLGWRRDLPDLLADTDLLALSSRNEGTPLAIVEAFAAGVPVVATRVGGVPEMFTAPRPEAPRPDPRVELRPEGALVAPGDARGLGAALARFGEAPELRAACGAAARAASERYDPDRLADAIAALYRELLEEQP